MKCNIMKLVAVGSLLAMSTSALAHWHITSVMSPHDSSKVYCHNQYVSKQNIKSCVNYERNSPVNIKVVDFNRDSKVLALKVKLYKGHNNMVGKHAVIKVRAAVATHRGIKVKYFTRHIKLYRGKQFYYVNLKSALRHHESNAKITATLSLQHPNNTTIPLSVSKARAAYYHN